MREKMKFTFETEDQHEALLYMNGPKFYRALEEIREMIRRQEKYGNALTKMDNHSIPDLVSAYREKINQIIYEEAPGFHEIDKVE